MSDIVKQQSKRFQRIFGNLPKQYGYCVTTENGISIVRDCKRWHFEIVGADKHVAKSHNRCVTVFVWDSTGTYRLAILYTVPDSKVHSAIEQFAVAHYHNKYPAECECWHWDKTELRYIPQAQIN